MHSSCGAFKRTAVNLAKGTPSFSGVNVSSRSAAHAIRCTECHAVCTVIYTRPWGHRRYPWVCPSHTSSWDGVNTPHLGDYIVTVIRLISFAALNIRIVWSSYRHSRFSSKSYANSAKTKPSGAQGLRRFKTKLWSASYSWFFLNFPNCSSIYNNRDQMYRQIKCSKRCPTFFVHKSIYLKHDYRIFTSIFLGKAWYSPTVATFVCFIDGECLTSACRFKCSH